ncbi:AMP-binding protein [Sulfitobacter pseudonitzschiae]|uniref:AMP-binding protein n=2 Tax=Roseobacteraceae TaxID=2854170 RepID=A0A073ITJ4_9RHOB|nr:MULTISPECIES: AMP-binding protein [Roseobacteraceae]KEJ93648.1 AMP-dependent synthetase [Pseudosulfitobacter pseudonitzschiae]MBM1818178.1 AMP-binding protein [Pseudosulfitobacter pseudonitzschiae]MBM1835232.1 AMP-binding protein [Pseudosulfitobacter pseudonitzschiae]MBM1840079.1 AMP-binding protein [Pseudosulfitobacter pseudonitzschiae]MBM1844943.1 AMP-binding protein [Pseudosulfitobacter pseudonitzschiae]
MNDLDARLKAGDHTLPQLLMHWAENIPDELAIREKDLGIWNRVTWAGYFERVRFFALGLHASGFGRGDRLAIASEDTPEWLYSDIAAQALGGMTVGVYPTNPWPELDYILRHSKSSVVVCGDQEQVDKVLDAEANNGAFPDLKLIVCVDMKGMRAYDRTRLRSFEEVVQAGRDHVSSHPEDVDFFGECIRETKPDDPAVVVYTSGTTGPPKGALLSHRNLLVASFPLISQFNLTRDRYSVVCYLPLCHVAERIFSTILSLMIGGQVNFAESIDTVQVNLREIAPKVFLGVPRIWEKLQYSASIRIQDARPLARRIYNWGLDLGQTHFRKIEAGGRLTPVERVKHFAAKILVFNPLKRFMGIDKVHCGFVGGASISPEVVRFFRVIGVPLYQVYGMTESAGLAFFQNADKAIVGASGVAAPGLQYRIADDGELEIKHPSVFLGYLDNQKATEETVVDGWLQTGDVVEQLDNGEIAIVDRKKSIIITSGGKNITPSEIENALKDSIYIAEAIVVGEGRNFLGALLQIDYDTVGKWAQAQGMAYTTFSHLSSLEPVIDLVSKEVARVNDAFARVENIRKFVLLKKQLDHDDGEMTATQKVRRNVIEKKFETEMAEIYG